MTSATDADGSRAEAAYTCDLDLELVYPQFIVNSEKTNGDNYFLLSVNQEDTNSMIDNAFPNYIRRAENNENCDFEYSL